MPSIVFLLGNYYPEVDANTICCNNIINELQSDGHKVIVIAGTANEPSHDYVNAVEVYRVKNAESEKNSKRQKSKGVKKVAYRIARMAKSIIGISRFPDVEPKFSRSLLQTLETITEKEQVDCIIGAFRPYATIKAMLLHRKNHPERNAKYIGYYLDVLGGAVKPFGAPKRLYDKLCVSADYKTFISLDSVLMAENGKVYYDKPLFDEIKGKIHYINFPMLVLKPKSMASNNKMVFTYIGYLDREYRNPAFVISLFNQLNSEGHDLKLNLYGTSNMDEEIKDLVDNKATFYHGRLRRDDVERTLMESDVLVSFGNNISGIVPSKIFELIGYKKPILHIVKDATDCSLQYLRDYPGSFILYENDGFEKAKCEVLSLLERKEFHVTDEYIIKTFYSATPEASTRIIYDCIGM